MSNTQNTNTQNTVMTDDTALVNALRNDDNFDELPIAFDTIDKDAISEMIVSIATSSSGITTIMRREQMTALNWEIVYGKLVKSTTIEKINADDHMCVVSWADTEGMWHRTLEGDMLASLLDIDSIDIDSID